MKTADGPRLFHLLFTTGSARLSFFTFPSRYFLRYRSPTPYLGCGEGTPSLEGWCCRLTLTQLLEQCFLATVLLLWFPTGGTLGSWTALPTGAFTRYGGRWPGLSPLPPQRGDGGGGGGPEIPAEFPRGTAAPLHRPVRGGPNERAPGQHSRSFGYAGHSGLYSATRNLA